MSSNIQTSIKFRDFEGLYFRLVSRITFKLGYRTSLKGLFSVVLTVFP